MLHFSNKPDAFFRTLMHDTLEDMLRTYSRGDTAELSSAEQCGRAQARAHVHALQTAWTDSLLYQLTEYHWFLLYEGLYYYSYSCNEYPLETPLYTEAGITLVDFDAAVNLFFADTDFLGHPTRGLTGAQRRMLEDPMERWALGVGVTPPKPDQLILILCPDQWRHAFEAAETINYASREIGHYPALPDPEADHGSASACPS